MPGLINFDAVDKDFTASLAAASKAVGDKLDDAPLDDVAGDDSADEEESDLLADDADDDADGEEDSEDEDNGADEGDAPDLGTVGEMFVSGDVDAACKALGIDPKVLKVNPAKLEAMRKGLKEAREKEAAATVKEAANVKEKQRLDEILTDAKRRYGPLVDLQAAVGLGDFATIQELLIAMAPKGTSWETIKAGLDNAGKTVTPGELAARRELKRLRDEQTAREAAEAAKQNQTQTAAQEQALHQKNLAGAATRLKGTDFDGIPGAPEKMVELFAANWDYTRNGLKVKPEEIMKQLAADPVISQLVELRKLKAGKGKTPAKTVPRSRGRGVVPQGNTKKADPKAAREKELRASMVEAERAEKATQRRQLRGHRGLR